MSFKMSKLKQEQTVRHMERDVAPRASLVRNQCMHDNKSHSHKYNKHSVMQGVRKRRQLSNSARKWPTQLIVAEIEGARSRRGDTHKPC